VKKLTKEKLSVKKRPKGERIFSYFNTVFLAGVTLIFLLPIWHVFCASVSDPAKLVQMRGLLLKPAGNITFTGYRLALKNGSIIRGYLNTIFYTTVATLIGMLGSAAAAYALSRPNLMWKKPIAFILSFTMLFNGGIIPTYLLVRNLHLLNTTWAIILPGCLSVYNILVMRTSFQALPEGLIEAARIDGAGHMRILFQIVIPCSKAIMAVIMLFYVVTHWNSWFHASLYIDGQHRDLFPLQLLLREIVIMNSQSALELAGESGALNLGKELTKYAVIVVSMLPMMAIYPFIQKYFVTGIMIGSIKE
jgi:putative aldouronate transport system permease protein